MRIHMGPGMYIDHPDPPEPPQACQAWKDRCRAAAQSEALECLSAEVHVIGGKVIVSAVAQIRGENVSFAMGGEKPAEDFGRRFVELFREQQQTVRRDAVAEKAKLIARLGHIERMLAA